MHNYNYQQTLQAVWQKAVNHFKKNKKDGSTNFNKDDVGFLASIGATALEIDDFAEAFVIGGEPDFTTVALIHAVRRAYFLEVQNGTTSQETIDPDSLPAKDSSAKGIRWLPRIIPKAKAKLRGELHPDVMYSCGGDRRFLRENDIHPAEFLRIVWQHENNDKAIIDWVVKRVKG